MGFNEAPPGQLKERAPVEQAGEYGARELQQEVQRKPWGWNEVCLHVRLSLQWKSYSTNFKEVEWQKGDQISTMASGEVQHHPGKEYCIVFECPPKPRRYELVPRNWYWEMVKYLKVGLKGRISRYEHGCFFLSFIFWPWTEQSHITKCLPASPPGTPTYCELK